MKIFGIGRNYKAHAQELNNELPSQPVVFTKPETALLEKNRAFYFPDFTKEIHHEIEIVVKICKVGKNIDTKFAHTYYDQIALGIDFTARDLQNDLKSKGLPWDIAKGFNHSAPISKYINISEFGDIQNINFSLQKNGETVQVGNTQDMIFSVNELIAHLSKFFLFKTGDLIFTGTPAGVGSIAIGDKLTGFIEDKKLLDFEIR